jgi:putative aldouronate transport system substrate-binding protein
MKRIERIPVVAAFVLALVFLGGMPVFGGARNQQAGGTVADAKPTLTIALGQNTFVTDYKDNYLTHLLESKHKVNLDFYMLPADANEARTKIALMVAANDLTDILMEGFTTETILDYGSKGALVALNKWLLDPQMAPNYAKIRPELKPLITSAITGADGNIYGFPQYQPETWNLAHHRIWINTSWLDKLGLPVPATTAELKTALLAFRDRDPNGNGKKDEIGITGQYTGGYGEDVITALINAFVFYNKGGLSLDSSGAKVVAPTADPAFRQALIYLSDLYKEGVLDPGIFTYNQQQFRSTINSEPMTVGFLSFGSSSNFPGSGTYDNPNFDQIMIIPPLKGPSGTGWVPYTSYLPSQYGFIASKSKYQEAAFKVLESFMDIEISMVARWGEEGVDWTRDPAAIEQYKIKNGNVMSGVFPSLLYVVLQDRWGAPSNKHWHNANPRYAAMEDVNTNRIAYTWSPDYDPDDKNTKVGIIHTQYYVDAHPRYVLPQLKYTVDEAASISESITNVNSYVDQSIAEFITGVRNISSDTAWNGYLRELDNLGLQKWLTTAQSAYNRQR